MFLPRPQRLGTEAVPNSVSEMMLRRMRVGKQGCCERSEVYFRALFSLAGLSRSRRGGAYHKGLERSTASEGIINERREKNLVQCGTKLLTGLVAGVHNEGAVAARNESTK